MQAATIVPQTYLHLIEDQSYHLALAHLLWEEGYEAYTDFYHKQAMAGKFVILDNGLIEGNPRPIEELVDKAAQLGASEMVLPDVFQNGYATLMATYDALKFARSTAPEGLRLGAVAQGSTMLEVIECAEELLDFNIDTLYIPKVVTSFGGANGRLFVLEQIQEKLGNRAVHLLGCWDTPMELKTIENYTRAGKIKSVRGVDSAIAYVHSRAGIGIYDGARPDSDPIDFKDGTIPPMEEFLRATISHWVKECAALPPVGGDDKIVSILR